MAKERRMLHSSLFRDRDWCKLITEQEHSYANGILLLGMILKSDDDGKGLVEPLYFKSDIFPCNIDIEVTNIIQMFDNIKKIFPNIVFYTHKDDLLYCFKNWKKYQKIRSDRYSESSFPNPTSQSILKGSVKNFFNKQNQLAFSSIPDESQNIFEPKPAKTGKIQEINDNPSDNKLLKKKQEMRKKSSDIKSSVSNNLPNVSER